MPEDDLVELLEVPGQLDQSEVMRRASMIARPERSLDDPILLKYLAGDQDKRRMIRASQVSAAWLPGSLALVKKALDMPSDETRFAILCALTDVPEPVMDSVEGELLPAVWRSVVTSKDSDVAYIGAKALCKFRKGAARRVINSTRPAHMSSFLSELLKDCSLLG